MVGAEEVDEEGALVVPFVRVVAAALDRVWAGFEMDWVGRAERSMASAKAEVLRARSGRAVRVEVRSRLGRAREEPR